LNNHF